MYLIKITNFVVNFENKKYFSKNPKIKKNARGILTILFIYL